MSDDWDDIHTSFNPSARKRIARRISESSSDSERSAVTAERKIRKTQVKHLNKRAFTSSNSSGVSSDESVIHAPSRKRRRRLSSDNENNNETNDSGSESEVIVQTVKRSSRAVIRSEEEDSSTSSSSSSPRSSSSSSSSSSSGSSTSSSTTCNSDSSFSVASFGRLMRRSKRAAAVAFVVSSDDEWSTSDSGTSSPNLPRLRNTRTNRIPTTSSSSSSSDSPVPRPRRAVSRTISAVSETTSDSSSEDEQVVVEGDENDWEDVESEEEIKATKKTKPVLPALASSSDSDDPSAEPCPICLRKLTTQEIGTPESCDHSFCLTCLQQWAKNVNTCPVDRQHFSMILVRKSGSDEILRSIRVENVEVVEVVDVVDDPTACEICGESDREDRLMLCDGCNRGYHLECMTPPLDHVPIEEWYCPDCNDYFIIPNEVLRNLFDIYPQYRL